MALCRWIARLAVAALICEMTDQLILSCLPGSSSRFPETVRTVMAQQTAIVAVRRTGRELFTPTSTCCFCTHAAATTVPGCIAGLSAIAGTPHQTRTQQPRRRFGGAGRSAFATALVERGCCGATNAFRHSSRDFAASGRRHFSNSTVRSCCPAAGAFGETERQLEPDVKRCRGLARHSSHPGRFRTLGTADLAMLRLEGALSRDDEQALVAAQEFITRIRVDLHFAAGKAQEVLTREEQLRLTELHGVSATAGQRPVERFMQMYFRHSTAVADISSRFVERHRPSSLKARICQLLLSHRSNHIFRVSATEIDVVPRYREQVQSTLESLLNLHELAALYSVRVAPNLIEQIRQTVPKLPPTVSPRAASVFRRFCFCRTSGQATARHVPHGAAM